MFFTLNITINFLYFCYLVFLIDLRSIPKLLELKKWLSHIYNSTEPSEADINCKPGDLCIAM